MCGSLEFDRERDSTSNQYAEIGVVGVVLWPCRRSESAILQMPGEQLWWLGAVQRQQMVHSPSWCLAAQFSLGFLLVLEIFNSWWLVFTYFARQAIDSLRPLRALKQNTWEPRGTYRAARFSQEKARREKHRRKTIPLRAQLCSCLVGIRPWLRH